MLKGLWLIHPDSEVCEAFAERFDGLPNVKVIRTPFESLGPHDCFVTAGNSFGMMTAGIDAAVVGRLGPEIEKRVQFRVMDDYFGEQPIGTAFIIPTGDPEIPFLAHAPTMRVPSSIEGSDKVYSATWAALLAIHSHNRHADRTIETVAFPAMGTGFGGVPSREAARQMAAAYRHYLDPPHRIDWDFVARRQKSICYDEGRQVVRS